MTSVTNLTSDQSTLLEFKGRILDPHNVLATNWTSTSTSPCHWIGISCSARHGRVTVLDLSGMGLEGSLDPRLGNLSFLVSLKLSGNNFHGYIPKELAMLHRLKLIDLSRNAFSGDIPIWFGNLTLLKALRLGGNRFQGEIPVEIGNFIALETFAAQNMKLINGPIPSTISECNNLQMLYLIDNRLNGHIPRGIGNLTRLKYVDLSFNDLEGEIPWEIGNLITLEIFYASDMLLSGLLPSSLFNISSLKSFALQNNSLSGQLPTTMLASNLQRLYLWGNNLSGKIPDSISNVSKLTLLSLDLNKFSGLIPDTLGDLRLLEKLYLWSNQLTTKNPADEWSFISSLSNCKNLRVLKVSSNPLNGILPTSISNLSASLEQFLAWECNIKGSIPMEIGNLSNIMTLDLERNELSGSIPATIGRLQKVQGLFLGYNKLQGSIPDDVCYLEKLGLLQLGYNMLQGPLPICLGYLTSLRSLDLPSNKLNSTIPLKLWSLKDLLYIDLSSNYLEGLLPQEIGNLKVLAYLNLSRNLLSSDIPDTIGGLIYLQGLSLANNRLQGPIPESLGDLVSLEALDLSNNFSGIIPKSLEKLSYLIYLNVSFNILEGEIPTEGCFINFTAKSFMMNYALCGSPRFEVPPCKASTHGPFKRTLVHVLTYALPPSAIFLIVAFIVIITKFNNISTGLSIEDDSTIQDIHNTNLYNKLLEATDEFSEGNLLGSGSFGSVYKGRLSNGKDVVVKVFNLQLERASNSFAVECEVMQKILHRNLVKVISCCSCIDFKALVLEFLPNGSLEKWLYSDNYFLDMVQRINIMIDVASALEYLHLGHPNPIVHCDLKPSNVLLDRDMVAHVGDFGISKLLGETESIKQTMTLATIGYMAPGEYFSFLFKF
ncbi:hypothetical protein PTKIN_Ptkin12aG0037000 [Pterospermum kingtungense]